MDTVSPEKRREIMRSIKGKDTLPELRLRKRLHNLGFRFRLHRRDLPGKPDVVLPKYRSVVFVHGCFWHGHQCKIGSGDRKPKSNVNYWHTKLLRNTKRDDEHCLALDALGWRVIVVWECETKDSTALDNRLQPLLKMKERL